MALTKNDCENEIRSWLEDVLKDENLKNLSVKLQGNTEKGEGYMGEIVFVLAEGTTDDHLTKKYDLVLKCSKRSQALRETVGVKDAFMIEILIYQKVLPYFIQYQKEKGVKDPFNSVPKFYGCYIQDDLEVIVFENLKTMGYELWPKKQPLSRRHIDLIVTEYAKYHATSVAVQSERPTEFQKFIGAMPNGMKKFLETGDFQTLFEAPIIQSYELLKNDLDDNVLSRWNGFKNQIGTVLRTAANESTGLNVIVHGDAWSNNFMFLHEKGEEKIPLKVAVLDWQVTRYASPIVDLSYFLFACLSKEDLEDLDDILLMYHTTFVNHSVQLEKPDTLYPLDQFLAEWNQHCKYGILMASLLMKIVSTEKDEVMDIAEVAESGEDVINTFIIEIRDKENYKRRIRPIVEYVVKHNLI